MNDRTDVATAESGDARGKAGAALEASGVDSEVFQRFLAAADDGNFDTDPEQVTLDIIARILKAETVEDVLGTSTATHARDYLNVPFLLTGVRFNRGDFADSGTNFYALLEGADDNGEPLVVSCGAKNVIAQSWKLADMGALPLSVVLKESPRQTANGYKPMWLEAGPTPY